MRFWAGITAIIFAIALAGCEPGRDGGGTPFKATDITGAPFGHDFTLVDHEGQRRTLADFKGKVVAVFFGYTHCPDVCPTTLADMALVAKKLGDDANRVQVLFITVDPARDTKEVLAQYVPAFDKRFLGLWGTPEETEAVAREFKVYVHKNAVSEGGGYTVDHTSGTYIFDPSGHLRLLVPYGQQPDAILHDVKVLLKG